jgi:M-phase phosphoprotein-6
MASLSKNVLSMKFMQRTKEKIEQKEEVISLVGKVAGDECTDSPEIDVWKTEDSVTPCQGLLFGRMSFRGYNPEIERLMAEKTGIKYTADSDQTEDPADVSVREMVQVQKGAATGNATDDQSSHRSGQVKRKRSHYIQPVDDS